LFGLGNDHLDSPASVASLPETMVNEDASDVRIPANTNSGLLNDDFENPVTGHFVAGFFR
jgi:hypothetical protein